MSNELYYNKYKKYKDKYIKLQNEIKGGDPKQWGFGVEQEFPIFIKPSDTDKANLAQFGINNKHFNLNYIFQNLDYKPYYVVFPTYDHILKINNLPEMKRIIFRKNVNMEEMESKVSQIITKVTREINTFILLPNKTTVSTIAILNNIYNEYKLSIGKYTTLLYLKGLKTNTNIILLETDIIYQDRIIKIYNQSGTIYIKHSINYDLTWLDTDSGGYEIRSDNFKNTTVKSVVKEIMDKKTTIKESLKRNFQIEDKNIIFLDKETMSNHDGYKYTGEPELNITLPYIINDDHIFVDNFKNQHINLMKSLQYLSPLFLSSFTGAYPYSFGDNKEHLETSYRYQVGSRILVTDVSNIYNQKYDKSDFNSYMSQYDTTHETIVKIYRIHYKKFNSNIHDNEIEGQDKIEFSVNRNANKFDPANGLFFGFEWKIFDQYPIKYVNNITLFVIMLAQHLQDYNIRIPEDPRKAFNVLDNSEWPFRLLEDVIYEGWNIHMEKYLDYILLLKDRLGLNKAYIVLEDKRTAFDLINSLHHSLFNYYKSEESNTDIIDCFFPRFKVSMEYEDFYDLPNINRNSFNNMINMMKEDDIGKFNLLEKKVTSNIHDEDFDDYEYYLRK